MKSAVIALLTLLSLACGADARAAKKAPAGIWVRLEDKPTGIVPHEKGYRVFFARHAAVYYLLKSDPELKKDLETIRQAIRTQKPVRAEAEATYLYLRNVTPGSAKP